MLLYQCLIGNIYTYTRKTQYIFNKTKFKEGLFILHIQLTGCQKYMFFEKGERAKQEDEHLGDGGDQRGIIMSLSTMQLSV